jgi:nitrate/TMAO reductase-like tetraheme cytochrome c subunit
VGLVRPGFAGYARLGFAVVSERTKQLLIGLVAAVVLVISVGWFGSDSLEQDNDFCNACHLEPGLPLHIDIREDFDARPVESLVGAHAAVMRPVGEPFLCIDCHGGVGLLGRARVKVLAGKDAFWWAVGHFEEPTRMRWPLWDADCRQCHPNFREGTDATSANPQFHALGVHNVELGVSCVECHLSHETGGDEDLYHLHPVRVRAQCARCHAEFG